MLHKMLVTKLFKAMKNIILKSYSVIALFAILFTVSCNETLYIDETIVSAPEITSFTPTSAPVGSEIYITGESLHNVTSAYIGGSQVTVFERVSDTSITIIADIAGASGVIKLVNANGSTESSDKFTYEYSEPAVSADCQVNVEMGEMMLIAGENLSAITNVYFKPTSSQDETLYEATISSVSATEILVTVPYVSQDDAELILASYDGSSSVSYITGHEVIIQRDKPVIDAISFDEATVGRSVTITGEFMNKISWIELSGQKAAISVQDYTTLSFTIPTNSGYEDGYNEDQILEAFYFDGYESVELSTSLKVYVPFVNYWQNILTYAQSRDAESLTCFFSPSDGIVYANSEWANLDVTAVALSGATINTSITNCPSTTEEQYNAVAPYFFFSVENGGAIAIYSPGNSSSQLKNYYTTTSSDSSITGGASWYGTPSLGFRWIDPAASVQAEVDLYNAVVNGTLEDISPENFPIDYDAKTINGISCSSISGALKDTSWAYGVFTDNYPGTGSNAGVDMSYPCDVVIMVLYYSYDKGDTTTGSTSSALDKVKRIGFVHITNIEYIFDSNGYAKSSSFLYNCYWQKYDYDYSEIPTE